MNDKRHLSDGYHTFEELYEHRHALFLALCAMLNQMGFDYEMWRAKQHADGTMFEGSFIAGVALKSGEQISYHFPLKLWDKAHFMRTVKQAPIWDGHNSADVVERLYLLINEINE